MVHYSSSISRLVTNALYEVFGWLSAGLAVTATVSYFIATHPAIQKIFLGNPISLILLVITQFLLIGAISAFYSRISFQALLFTFFGYATLTGVTLSVIFLVYELSSIIGIFFIASGMFAAISAYGLITKHDLTQLGYFMYASLFGLVILQLINFFVRSSSLDWGLAFVGILIFAGVTAFDIQRIKNHLGMLAHDNVEQKKIALVGAVEMYLDFLNIFLRLLRILGKKKQD